MLNSIKKIAIIGIGLIGGSIGLACKKKEIFEYIVGIDTNRKTLEKAVEIGAVDEVYTEYDKKLNDIDLIIVSTPINTIENVIKIIIPFLKKDAIITDVGSVKRDIILEIESFLPSYIFFIGGHPIAGKELSGIEASTYDLFENRTCILTPSFHTSKESLETVKELWEKMGSSVSIMEPERHDIVLAAISHLPHIVASSLINAVSSMSDISIDEINFAGGGFRDVTRIASSQPELWKDISIMNCKNILTVIDNFEKSLTTFKDAVKRMDGECILKEFTKSKKIRDSLK